MIKQLITFNGGLSTKVAPNLIAPNEAVECNNVDLEEGTLKPVKDSVYLQDVTGTHGYYINGGYIFNSTADDDRFYVEFANTLYWSNANGTANGLMRYDGTAVGEDATPPPSPNQISVAAISGGNMGDATTYYYCYTFVDSSYLEGTPTVFAQTSTASPNLQIEVTINPTNTPADATQVRIYRQGGSNPTFNLIGEVDLEPTPIYPKTFTDNTRDIDVSRVELTTFENTPPPDALDMLIENNGTFWGSVGDRVYFSRTGSPYFWGTLDYVRLDSQCTGLGRIGSSIIAFTSSDMYQIDGWNRDNITRRKLEFNQGCKNKRTVANVNNYLFWVSDNGICLYDGGSVVVVTKNILSWNEFAKVGNSTWSDYVDERYNSGLGFEISYATSYQDKYYGVYADGIVVIDISNGIKASTLHGSGIQSLVYNKSDNVLNYVYDNASQLELHTILSATTDAVAVWKTGELADEGITIRKFYRKVNLIGDLGTDNEITVFIDGESKIVISDRKEFFLPSGSHGYSIQFLIKTNGELSGLKYEYSIGKV